MTRVIDELAAGIGHNGGSPLGNVKELPTLGEDLLRGVPAIAKFIGEEERKARYLCEKRLIPVGKLGGIFVASRTKIAEHYDRVTSGLIASDVEPDPVQPPSRRGRRRAVGR
jgi:hypothetical protein